MSEANLRKRFKTGIEKWAYYDRIENAVTAGMPDIILHHRTNGKECWVETKHRPELPKRDNTPVFKGDHGLNPDQVSWIYCRAEAGANIFVLGQAGNHLWLIHGQYARALENMSARDLYVACDWHGPARCTDWAAIKGIMFR